ncbi:Probable folate-biopterin transporter 3 [Durusdinium trenchii]|uniref:Probable folate-biopterin transporter 3 n=1 Tax=Durusdinium trenchii TaxID=1381693 RepID=A0ABP0MY48_9DINO
MVLFSVQHLIKGFVANLSGRATPYLFKSFHVPAQEVQIWKTCIFSPYILKPIFGLISDLLPIWGFHKGPYLFVASSGGVAAALALGLGINTASLAFLVVSLFLVELCICIGDLLTEALYARQMQDHPRLGQSLLTYVFAGMSAWSLLGNLSSGFMLSYLGAHGTFLALAPAIAPAVLTSAAVPEEAQSAEAVRAKRLAFWHQKEACALAFLLLSVSLLMSLTAITTKDPAVNALMALLAASLVIGSFSMVLSPVIAKFSVFTLVQTSLHLSVSAPAFYFLTDDEEEFPQGPHFSPLFYNSCLGCIGGMMTLVGLYSYNRFASMISYRRMIVASNLAFSLLHLTDMVLFSRLNVKLGIPDVFFAFGNQSLGVIIYQWLWMPQVALFSQLCPKDMEATMFALVVSCHNLGVAVASATGAWLLAMLKCNPRGRPDESKEFQMLWLASGISSMLPLFSIFALFWLIPNVRPAEPIELRGDGTAGSLWNQWRSHHSETAVDEADERGRFLSVPSGRTSSAGESPEE